MAQANLPTTPLRAVDIPATDQHNLSQQWFFTDDDMHRFLAARMIYAAKDGSIKDTDGEIVGLWYFAEFSCKYPGATTDQGHGDPACEAENDDIIADRDDGLLS